MNIFQSTEVAFKIKSNSDLTRALWLFRLISFGFVVKAGNKVIPTAIKLGIPMSWIVKPTVFKHFCGGETLSECAPAVEKLGSANVKAILDYSVEGGEDDKKIEVAFQETLKSIEFAGKNPNIPFAVFKPTAFIKSFALEVLSSGEEAGAEAREEGEKFKKRVTALCTAAFDRGLPILIDAEDSFYQPFIDEVVMDMMSKFNREKAIVFNTYQMYRWDRLEILKNNCESARKGHFFLGAKFVRGAYMERERERAKVKGYRDPIQPDKESTDRDYNAALKFSVENIDVVSIFNGTHNEESCLYLMDLMTEHGIKKDDARIWFSQLYGMSDHISFNLALAGYNVAKYLPYGPVKHVLPYLLRRVEENSSVSGQTGRELSLILAEMKRRKKQK
ncbi:MAG: proline dehydrogenase family protein [Bacteroidales bacterium]|nr:proline dehydrogenase family protein [Bacteroidales bacterium]